MKMQKKLLNATTLKLLAVVLMVLDHIHQMWAMDGAPMWLTWLGRLVFPIFLFAMSESFHYTRSRKKLLLRLLIASCLMSGGNMLLESLLPNPDVVLMNNAFSTFFVAALYMLAYTFVREGIRDKKAGKVAGGILLFLAPVATAIPLLILPGMETPAMWLVRMTLLVPNLFMVEGGPLMVLLGLLFYVFRRWRWAQIAALGLIAAISLAAQGLASVQWFMVFAAVPIFLYNGEKGKGMKQFFYFFYPGHIYLLYVVATLMK